MVPPHLLSDDRSKDWHNLGPTGSVRSWPKDGVNPSPFKSGPVAPLCKLLPGGNPVVKIRTNIEHTYAINGYGKDDLASSLLFVGRNEPGSTVGQSVHGIQGVVRLQQKDNIYTSL